MRLVTVSVRVLPFLQVVFALALLALPVAVTASPGSSSYLVCRFMCPTSNQAGFACTYATGCNGPEIVSAMQATCGAGTRSWMEDEFAVATLEECEPPALCPLACLQASFENTGTARIGSTYYEPLQRTHGERVFAAVGLVQVRIF